MQKGNWATELEILALAHMLCVDIYTYSNDRWIKYSVQNVCASIRPEDGGIYLNHMNDNHYDVVIDITDLFENTERNNFENEKSVKREKRCSERVITKEEVPILEVRKNCIGRNKRKMYNLETRS